MSILEKYGPWALVTGASSGIGASFTRRLASLNFNVILVARREDRLKALASELSDTYKIKTHYIVSDLSKSSGVEAVRSGTEGFDIGLLVNNAGVEHHGSFIANSEEAFNKLISLNITAVTTLAHFIGSRMIAKGRQGGVIFTSSAAKGGFPWFATYSASKAYVSMLAIMLRLEWRDVGIDVFCLEPGLTDTEMKSNDLSSLGFPLSSADDCVDVSLAGLEKGLLRGTPNTDGEKEADDALENGLAAVSDTMKKNWSPEKFDHKKNLD